MVAFGSVANVAKFPYMVLLISTLGECGGSVISSKFIISAAHCLEGQLVVDVYFGIRSRRSSSNLKALFKQKITSKNFYFHPNYDNFQFIHDIILVKLKRVIQFTEFIQPVHLPSYNMAFEFSHTFIAIGWGQTQCLRNFDHVFHLVTIKTTHCLDSFPHQNANDVSNLICSVNHKKKTCVGDSGSPLMLKSYNVTHTIIGITSYGNSSDCGRKEAISTFSNVYFYKNWIHHVTGEVFN